MKKMQTVLLSMFFLCPALTAAQTSPSVKAVAGSRAQPLRRYQPQMRNVEKKTGEDTWYVNIEKAISPATERALFEYFTGQYTPVAMVIDIYRAPVADNLYFVLGTVRKDKQSEDSEFINVFVALREQGGIVSEVSKAENENDALLRAPVFFLGQNKILAIVTLSAGDGSLFGHFAYEYAGNNFKPLGEIPVIDKLGMSGQVWVTNNQIEGATAEYKNSNYYLTVRGKGSLYHSLGDNNKKLAPPRSPVTFFYDGKEWRPVAAKRAGRK